MATTLDTVVDSIRRALEPRAEILEAYVFGSLARGEEQPHSDVDVAVWVDELALHESAFGYEADLTSVLIAALGRNDVDVVRLNRASPLLYHRVLRDGVRVLSRDLRATTVREGRALSRWCDWVPVQRRIDAILRARRLREGVAE